MAGKPQLTLSEDYEQGVINLSPNSFYDHECGLYLVGHELPPIKKLTSYVRAFCATLPYVCKTTGQIYDVAHTSLKVLPEFRGAGVASKLYELHKSLYGRREVEIRPIGSAYITFFLKEGFVPTHKIDPDEMETETPLTEEEIMEIIIAQANNVPPDMDPELLIKTSYDPEKAAPWIKDYDEIKRLLGK